MVLYSQRTAQRPHTIRPHTYTIFTFTIIIPGNVLSHIHCTCVIGIITCTLYLCRNVHTTLQVEARICTFNEAQAGRGTIGRGRIETGIGLNVGFLLCGPIGKAHEVAVDKRTVLCRAMYRVLGPAVGVRVVEVMSDERCSGT